MLKLVFDCMWDVFVNTPPLFPQQNRLKENVKEDTRLLLNLKMFQTTFYAIYHNSI